MEKKEQRRTTRQTRTQSHELNQEEEIFELAHMTDEDKVMAALWSRFMLVHRYTLFFIVVAANSSIRLVFLASRYKGVLFFVESNYRMIRKTVGRDGLRVYLLVIDHPCVMFRN